MYKPFRRLFSSLLLFALFHQLGFAYTGQIIKSFKAPGTHPTGLTFDGQNLWLADQKSKKIYCINPENGKLIRSIPTPGYWPTGLCYDGKALWNADIKGGLPGTSGANGKIFRISLKDGTILKTLDAPSRSPQGLTWDGEYLWCTDNQRSQLIKFSSEDGTTLDNYRTPAEEALGLTFDGNYLWATDKLLDEIHMIDPGSGDVILITPAPGRFPVDVCYDGEYLWTVDDQANRIYQIRINDSKKYRKTNPSLAMASFTHQTTNFGPGLVKRVDIHFALPQNRINQTIIGNKITFSPKNFDYKTDQWGQKTGRYILVKLEPGFQIDLQMQCKVKNWDTRYYPYPDKIGSLDEIPDSITNIYLEDKEKYNITHPLIQEAVEKAVNTEENPYWIARKIYNYLLANLEHQIDNKEHTAPWVLKKGGGSCSEYAFVYISMCRAAGLPARYAGGFRLRNDDTKSNQLSHRWAEVYLPNFGWLPVDPAEGDKILLRDQAYYFGFESNRYLTTTVSGGRSQTLDWNINCNQTWKTAPKTNIVFDYFLDWNPIKE